MCLFSNAIFPKLTFQSFKKNVVPLYLSKKTLFDRSNYIDNSVYVMYLITKYNCVYLLVGINLKENY